MVVKKNFKKLHHVGVVVKDINKAIAYFEQLDIGPFAGPDGKKTFAVSFNGELHGKPATWTTTISNTELCGVQLELLEPTKGVQALKDKTGEGLHHIGFVTDDLEAEVTDFKKAGIDIWTKAKGEFLYFDPLPVGGIAIEFREMHGSPFLIFTKEVS